MPEGLENRLVLSTITWNNAASPTGGSWDTASNWVGGVIPGSNDDAVISLTSGTVSLTAGVSDSVHTVTTNSSTVLEVMKGVLTIAAGSTLGNGLMLDGGTVKGAGALTLNGNSAWSSGTVSCPVVNSGTITVTSTSVSSVSVANAITNTGTIEADGPLSNGGGSGSSGSILNSGIIQKTSGTDTSTISLAVTGGGSITASTGILAMSGGGTGGTGTSGNATVTASGTGVVQLGGTWGGALVGTGTDSGEVVLNGIAGSAQGLTLNFTGSVLQWGHNAQVTGPITNLGTLTIPPQANSSSQTLGGTLTNNGTIEADAPLGGSGFGTTATILNNGTIQQTSGSSSANINVLVNGTGLVTASSGTLFLGGGGTAGSGTSGSARFTASGAGIVQIGGTWGGTLTGSGTGGGLVQLNGIIGASSGLTLNFTGTVLQVAPNSIVTGPLTNIGTLTVPSTSNPSAETLSGTLANSGTLEVDGALGSSGNGTAGTIVNTGTIQKTSGTGIGSLGVAVSGAGSINATSGTLKFTGGGTGGSGTSGVTTITVSNGAIVILSGTWGGSLTGSGTGGGTVQVTGFLGAASGVTLNFSGTTLQFAVNGAMSGKVTNVGQITVPATSGYSLETLGGTFTNTGTIEIDGSLGKPSFGTPGIIVNSGTIQKTSGTGTGSLALAVSGSGTITSSSGTLSLTGGGTGGTGGSSTANVTASSAGVVQLGGTWGGTLGGTGSGSGSVQLNGFTGSSQGATLNFVGPLLQWALNGLVTGTVTNVGMLTIPATVNASVETLAGTLVNSGTIEVDGKLSNGGGTSSPGMISNTGIIQKLNGTGTGIVDVPIAPSTVATANLDVESGTLSLTQASLELDGQSYLSGAAAGTLSLTGSLIGNTTNVANYAPQAVVQFSGSGTASSPQQLEVMSNDLGNVPAGFMNNFAYQSISLAGSTYVQLIDNADNSTGSGSEALYVNTLNVPSGTTLDLNGLHVYARNPQISGTILNGTVNVDPILAMTSFTAGGNSVLTATYQITATNANAFRFGIYRSTDRTFSSGDTLVSSVQVTDPSMLTPGSHVLTIPFNGVVADSNSDSFLLGVADDQNTSGLDDSNNTMAVVGAYIATNNTLVVEGSAGADSVDLSSSSVVLTLPGGSQVTYSTSGLSTVRVRGHEGNDSVILDSSATLPYTVSIFGGGGSDSLTLPNMANTVTISGSNAGYLTGASFNKVGTLIGGSGNDVFKFTSSSLLSGSINGGGGTNTLDYSALTTQVTFDMFHSVSSRLTGGYSNIQSVIAGSFAGNQLLGPHTSTNYFITGANAGNVNGVTFTGFARLVAGQGNDTFKFSDGASLSSSIEGGNGTNAIDESAYTTSVVANFGAGTITGIGQTYTNIRTITAGSASNTITGPTTSSTYTITGTNTAIVGPLTFSHFGTIIGGAGNDTFVFGTTAVITNMIDGGGGTNTFDFSAFTSQVSLNLATSTVSRVANPFANIQSFIGGSSSGNQITGPAANTTFNITGSNTGNVNGLTFSSFGRIIGGAGNDTFVMSDGAGLSNGIDGGSGSNWLDYAAYTSPITVNLTTGAATGFGSSIANIRNVRGGSGNDTLTGNSQGNTLIGGPGNDIINGGSGRSILIGGAGSDTINGGSNDDIIINGTTSFDGNFAALDSILAEWKSSDSYATRINLIKNGGGLNGSNTLVWGTTVIDDNTADVLHGNAGNDWFFEGTGDTADNVAGEQVN